MTDNPNYIIIDKWGNVSGRDISYEKHIEILIERDALRQKLGKAKEALEFIGELPETNAGYWKVYANRIYKQLEAE